MECKGLGLPMEDPCHVPAGSVECQCLCSFTVPARKLTIATWLRITGSWNNLGWKKPLRTSSPAADPALPSFCACRGGECAKALQRWRCKRHCTQLRLSESFQLLLGEVQKDLRMFLLRSESDGSIGAGSPERLWGQNLPGCILV